MKSSRTQQIRINQKSNGQHLRVTVEHKPQDLSQLTKLQQQVLAHLPEFVAKDPEYIHLTLLHLGIPQDIYFEFRHIVPNLTQEDFMDSFVELLQDLHSFTQLPAEAITIEGSELNLYGSAKSPAVALSIKRNQSLDQLHQGAYHLLKNFVAQYTYDPTNFIASSRNFRHSPPEIFNPHITLGRIPTIVSNLPTITPISLSIGQPYLAHVTVM